MKREIRKKTKVVKWKENNKKERKIQSENARGE